MKKQAIPLLKPQLLSDFRPIRDVRGEIVNRMGLYGFTLEADKIYGLFFENMGLRG